jgi:DNA-binding beta-propeller fold protein YncE
MNRRVRRWPLTAAAVLGLSAALTAQSTGSAQKPAAPAKSAAPAKHPLARPVMVVDRPPVRVLEDRNPTFNAIALNEKSKEVFISNNNKASVPSVLVYPTDFRPGDRVMEPRRRIAGANSRLGDFCGMALSPENQELYTVQGEDTEMKVFPIDGHGDISASRTLTIAHGAADVHLDKVHDELFISTEHINRVSVYRRAAEGEEKPLRIIQGPHTGLADPHGLYVDPATDELFVTNYGNFRATNENDDTESTANEDSGGERKRDKTTTASKKPKPPRKVLELAPSTGRFVPPFISVFSRTAQGDAAPQRVIQGPHTGLNLPLGITRDPQTHQIVVANSGDNAVLFFAADASGDVAPVRVLKGSETNLRAPTGVAVDASTLELWVTSWENHLANVFPALASGNVAPTRFLRSAPKDAAPATFGTPGAVAWDPKRQEILVPN